MNATTKTNTAPKALVEVPVEQVMPHPKNPRRDITDAADLAASIREHGIRQNLLLAPRSKGMKGPKSAKYVVIAGHRRFKAAKQAGLATVPAVIDETLTDPVDQMSLMLTENGQRVDLSAIEEAEAYQGLLDLGVSLTDLAKRVSRKRATVKDRVALGGLSAEVKEKVHTHQVTIADAAVLTEFMGHPDLRERAERALGTDRWVWEVQWCRQDLERKEKLAEQRKALTADGVRVLETKPEQLEEDAAAWGYLEELFLQLGDVVALDEFLDKYAVANPDAKIAEAEALPDDVDTPGLLKLEAWHRHACPHHAATPRRGYEDGFHSLCLDADVHEDLITELAGSAPALSVGTEMTTKEREEREAAAAAQLAAEEELAAVAKERRAWLLECAKSGPSYATALLLDDLATRAGLDRLANTSQSVGWEAQGMLTTLGLDPATTGDQLLAHLDDLFDGLPLSGAVLIHQMLRSEEPRMEHGNGWKRYVFDGNRSVQMPVTWVDRLRFLGYPFSNIEIEQIPKGHRTDAEAAQLAAADVAYAAGGEVA
ncbi:ParB/RepB/Spo0J family partition protein [Ornithinimicrobium sp. Arc0846-15]|nr:ParB/RepB/Spo0J family partition protein [Ornithinimicrobium laminariae]